MNLSQMPMMARKLTAREVVSRSLNTSQNHSSMVLTIFRKTASNEVQVCYMTLMFPLVSIVCVLVATFIVLAHALLFCVGLVISRHQSQHLDEV
jgi:hypothetical protein